MRLSRHNVYGILQDILASSYYLVNIILSENFKTLIEKKSLNHKN